MNQYLIENIYEHKKENNRLYYPTNRNGLNELNSIGSVNLESDNAKNKNPLDSELINEDIDRENGLFQLNSFPNMNPVELNNIIEHKNISSMNTTNENKIYDYFSKVSEFPNYLGLLKKKKIFEISKVNKKLGRLKKNSVIAGKHDKLAEDNIIRKIKRRFLENLRLYINKEYKNYRLEKNKITNRKNWLKKINPKYTRVIKKNENLKLFSLKVYEVFSDKLSIKYTSHNSDLNKRIIQNVLSTNETSRLKDILNTSIETFYERYISKERFGEFKTLEDDINELEKQMKESGQENIKQYLTKYKDTAINLKNIFSKKLDRNRKKN